MKTLQIAHCRWQLAVLLLVLSPLQQAYSRHLESEADWSALQTTRNPGVAEALFRRFTRIALIEPTSPTWSNLLFGSHPDPMHRIEMAAAWRRLNSHAR